LIRMYPLTVVHIGRTKYADAWSFQQTLLELRQAGLVDDVLILTEHDHVYTHGKSSDNNHLLASIDELKTSGIDVHHIDRGGDVTYHGPGQIVGYPILDLHRHGEDIHLYLRNLEKVIIKTLGKFAIVAGREEGMTGVWVDGEKIAAIGVKVSRWVSMHGFALNVNTDLSKFSRIIPCGIFHKGVTSMQKIDGRETDMHQVEQRLIESFTDVFASSVHRVLKRKVGESFEELTAALEFQKRDLHLPLEEGVESAYLL
jgi:lipoate-protein ligase B